MGRSCRAVRSLLLCAPLLLAAASARGAADFQGIGDLPGGAFESAAFGVSADGRVVVGSSETAVEDGLGMLRIGNEPVRWDAATGIQGLGFEASPFPFPGGINEARAASADGSVIVGGGNFSAFRWTEATGSVPTVGGAGPGASFAVSADGSVEAGAVDRGVSRSPFVRRTPEGQPSEDLFPLVDGEFTVGAFRDLAADGSLAVGSAATLDVFAGPAVRWTEAAGIESLGTLPGGSDVGVAEAVSADGSVIFGFTTSARGQEAFRWTEAEEMISLGDLTSTDDFASGALDATADGLVAVGRSSAGAFVWDESNGMRELAQVLADEFGLDLDGWLLEEATGISANGLVIVGNGTNPSGQAEGWVATIPEPSTSLLLAIGLVALRRR